MLKLGSLLPGLTLSIQSLGFGASSLLESLLADRKAVAKLLSLETSVSWSSPRPALLVLGEILSVSKSLGFF